MSHRGPPGAAITFVMQTISMIIRPSPLAYAQPLSLCKGSVMPEKISYEAIEVGQELDPVEYLIDTETVRQYCEDWADLNPLYLDGSSGSEPIMPPAYMAGLACFHLLHSRWNSSGTMNVATEHRNFRPVRVGDRIIVKGRIVEKFIRRGLDNIVVQSEAYDGMGNLVRESIDRIVLSMERREAA